MSEAELVKRLERLERDDRRLKKFGAAALVVAAILGTMAATRPVPQKIVAHEFDVVDGAGNVRAELHIFKGEPSFGLFSSTGELRASMNVEDGSPHVGLYGEGGSPMIGLGIRANNFMGLVFSNSPSSDPLSIGVVAGERPTIELADAEGYRMDLGSTQTVTPATGQTQQTSADSIVMFGSGKKHRVIWKAPQ